MTNQTDHDELAAVRHLIATTLAEGFGSEAEAAAERALLADYFRGIADPASGDLVITRPVRLVNPVEALAAMRVVRMMYGQRQLMSVLDEMMPEKGFGEAGLLDAMTEAIEVLLTMLTAYLDEHGALPPTTSGSTQAPDRHLAALLRQMEGVPHA